MIDRLPVVLLALSLLIGCGEDAAAPEHDADQKPPKPASEREPDAAPPAAPPEEGTAPDAPPSDASTPTDGQAEPEQRDPDETPRSIEKLKSKVVGLVRATEFSKALRLCREARAKMPAGPERQWVSQKIVELTRASRQAVGLPFAMRKLAPDQPVAARDAARQRLRRAGEVGRIFLRKAVRDRQPTGVAVAAANVLREWGDRKAANLVTRELMDPPAEPLRGALVNAATANTAALDLSSLVRLTRFASTEAGSAYRDRIREALEQAARRDFAPEALDDLYARTQTDPTLEHRHAVRWLALVYAEGAGHRDERFNAMFTVEDPLTDLRSYAERAMTAENARIAQWGEVTRDLLRRFNFDELRRGLLAWWAFDDRGEKLIEDLTPGGHDAEMIGKNVPYAEGVLGAALRFPGDNRGVESRRADGEPFRTIQESSFSFAAWVKPDHIPAGDQPDAYWGIVTKEGWHIGLMLRDDGRFGGLHYLGRDESAHAHSTTRAEPGQWHHLAMSVDLQQGRIKLYVNGALEGSAEFRKNADGWNRYRGKPVRVGLARFGHRNWACRFQGEIDEVAIYQRALTDDDAQALHRLRSASVRAKLVNPE